MPDATSNDVDRRQAIEAALADRRRKTLPPDLAALYEAREAHQRGIRLVRVQIVNAIASMLGLAIVWFDKPEAMRAGIPLSAVVSSLFLASALLLRRAPGAAAETALFVVPHLAQMLAIEWLGQHMPVYLADRYIIVAATWLANTIAVATMRMRTALALGGLAICLYPLPILLTPGPVWFPRDLDLPVIMLGAVCIDLVVAYRNNIERQRQFLLILRHELAAAEINAMNGELARLSNTDSLTGLANRRQLDSELSLLWQAHPPPPIGVVLIDIDHFKRFNDSAGHAAGDHCLRQVAKAIAGAVRRGDLAARFGGEEFAVILPCTVGADLFDTAERLRRAVADLELPHPGLPGSFVTISAGVAYVARPTAGITPDCLLQAADMALYDAKHAGRNRVVGLDAPLEPPNLAAISEPGFNG